jgi:predicted amino acid dehydrogenase
VIGTIPTRSTDTPIYRYRKDRSSQQQNVDVRTGKAPRRVAWVFHLIDESDLAHMDAALENLTAKEKSAFFDRWSSLCEPVVMDTVDIQSATDEVVRLYPILLPVTSAWMLKNSRGRGLSKATTLVQKAVDAAAALHCDVVSLGQFTSIVTHRGGSLQDRNLHITTGNNYTTALVTQAIRAELNQRSLDPKELTLGVIGAAGDIGSTCASMMAPDFRNCILAGSGRVGSLDRLKQVATEIPSAKVATSLRAMEDAHVVVCATNSTAAPIGPEHLHSRAIVCDVSVPATIRPRISDVLPQVTIVPGAIVALPRREHLGIPGFPLPIGFTYGCMAEGLLLGLDGGSPMQWTGPSSSRRVFEISQIAARHGFQVGEPSSSANLSESSS